MSRRRAAERGVITIVRTPQAGAAAMRAMADRAVGRDLRRPRVERACERMAGRGCDLRGVMEDGGEERVEGELPRGARPDLSVDGTIELERLNNVLFVGRPAFGQEQSTVGLFKLDLTTGEASRAQVQLGRSSVNTIEILGGLAEGDQVVLSDMSAWDQFERIRLR